MVICPECHGSGNCSYCQGRGYSGYGVWQEGAGSRQSEQGKRCVHCAPPGNGRCAKCLGTGYVQEGRRHPLELIGTDC